jgi:Sugar (and other) transporter.
MVVQVTPPGIANLGWKFWIIWACICFSFIPITYLFYPETSNRTLEDIDRFFEGNPGLVVAWDKGAFCVLSSPSLLFYMNERERLNADLIFSGNTTPATRTVYPDG